jgi:anti-sigma-K factor RskA
MSEDKTTHYRENIAAYALGALDKDEALQLEDHLAHCQECQRELAEYQAVSKDLLSALPPLSPHPSVKKQLTARLQNSDKGKTSAGSFWDQIQFSFGQAAAAMAVIILVGVNIFSFLQIRGMRHQQTELSNWIRAEQSAIAILAQPGTEIIPAGENGEGSLLINIETNTAVLLAQNLPDLPDDNVYQIWLIDPAGERVSGGLFSPNTDLTYEVIEVEVSDSLQNFVALGITIEPWGGSPGPTGTNIFKVTF